MHLGLLIDFLLSENVSKLILQYSPIFIAIIGWIIALVLQRANTREQHAIQVRYEIYKQLLDASKETQEAVNELGTISAPLVLMDSALIPYKVGLTKEYKDIRLPYTEEECVFEGEKEWNSFINESFERYFTFGKKYLEMRYIFDGWAAAIEPLLETQTLLNEKVNELNENILRDLKRLQNFPNKKGHDWRKWERKEIEEIVNRITAQGMELGMYVNDLMVLIHNELLSKNFSYTKPLRKTLDPEYKVLTANGFEVRLEENREELWKQFQEKEELRKQLDKDLD